jgi:Tripartite tricarboxylate transporter TctB family
MILRQQALGGIVVAALAAFAIVGVRNLDVGTLDGIGPGLFPIALASLLLALGLAVALTPARAEDGAFTFTWQSARGLIAILGAVAVFGFTIRPLGLTLATPIAIMISGLADRDTRWLELSAFAVVLTLFCAGLFRFVLGLPIPFAPWLLGY